jgi:hypothetical protein
VHQNCIFSEIDKALIWVPISDSLTKMKTTLDISDPLFKQAKATARREGTTVRALVERGLRLALGERRTRPGFRLRDAAVQGKGLQREAAQLSWDQLRMLTYEGRGD